MTADPPPQPLLTAVEVARLFSVDPKTVRRWAGAGLLPCLRTPTGYLRFRLSDVRRALQAEGKL